MVAATVAVCLALLLYCLLGLHIVVPVECVLADSCPTQLRRRGGSMDLEYECPRLGILLSIFAVPQASNWRMLLTCTSEGCGIEEGSWLANDQVKAANVCVPLAAWLWQEQLSGFSLGSKQPSNLSLLRNNEEVGAWHAGSHWEGIDLVRFFTWYAFRFPHSAVSCYTTSVRFTPTNLVALL